MFSVGFRIGFVHCMGSGGFKIGGSGSRPFVEKRYCCGADGEDLSLGCFP